MDLSGSTVIVTGGARGIGFETARRLVAAGHACARPRARGKHSLSLERTLGVPDLAVYTATKWAVCGLTESLRHEAENVGSREIRFSSVHPNYVAHGLFEGARIPGLGGLLVPRVGAYDDVAGAIVEKCLRRGRRQVLLPPTVRLAVLLRALLPYPVFLWVTRALGVHRSMESIQNRVGKSADKSNQDGFLPE